MGQQRACPAPRATGDSKMGPHRLWVGAVQDGLIYVDLVEEILVLHPCYALVAAGGGWLAAHA